MADKAPWRQEIELLQAYQKHATFTHTTSSSSAETALNLVGKMEEGNKVSFVVETGGAYVAFDEDASSSTGMLVPADEGYFDDNIYFSSKISIIREGSTNARIRGIVWGR